VGNRKITTKKINCFIPNFKTDIMGTTVANLLISYDINKLHTQVKTALEKLGFHGSFKNKNDSKVYQVPNTTMCYQTKSSDQAIKDLKSICNDSGVKLEKAVAVKATEFVGF
jgi:hypothetical protein